MEKEQTAVFVYAKDGRIQALSHNDSLLNSEGLKREGWIHTHTIDPCVWIEHLHNSCGMKDVLKEIDSLQFRVES